MKRRTFLKLSAAAPFYFQSSIAGKLQGKHSFFPATVRQFDLLEIKGSYQEIGYRIGKYFGGNIKAIIRQRKEWHERLMNILATEKGRLVSGELKRLVQKYYPQYLEELTGMADGAGIAFPALWAISVKSELGALEKENPGCSTIFYHRGDKMWLFHNEDGHTAYRDRMFLVKVHPPSGVSFISLVYPGTLTGNGPSLNNRGVVQTTNYIGSTQSEIGIPRYVIGRAILEAKSLEEAGQIAMQQPRAYPYHHNLAGFTEKKYLSLETIPNAAQQFTPKGVYCHTNHLLLPLTKIYRHENQEYKNSSSMSRYTVLSEKIKNMHRGTPATPATFLEFLSSHENAPYSPCRHPRGEVKGQTLAIAFFDINRSVFRLYKGNPCRAVSRKHFQEYSF